MGKTARTPLSVLLIASLLGSFVGCSAWSNSDAYSGVARLPHPVMPKDSVGIEIATVTFDATDRSLLEKVLLELDEQVLDPHLRRQMSRNGFVGGLLGTQLPSSIQVLLLEAADRRTHPTAENQVDTADQQRFVQCRPGQRKGIGLWSTANVMTLQQDDGEFLVPVQYQNATALFGMRCRQTSSSTAIVTLTPEIKHGPLRQKFIVQNSSIHRSSEQETTEYSDLNMGFPLASGETLLLTCNELEDLLGQRMFQNETGTRQKMLLVRLAQTQVDLSFGDE